MNLLIKKLSDRIAQTYMFHATLEYEYFLKRFFALALSNSITSHFSKRAELLTA